MVHKSWSLPYNTRSLINIKNLNNAFIKLLFLNIFIVYRVYYYKYLDLKLGSWAANNKAVSQRLYLSIFCNKLFISRGIIILQNNIMTWYIIT